MKLRDFDLERYFARWEFEAPYLLCCSDIEGYRLDTLLKMADKETGDLWANLTLGYTESSGHPLLRKEMASLYESVHSDDLLTFAGPRKLSSHSCTCCWSRGITQSCCGRPTSRSTR